MSAIGYQRTDRLPVTWNLTAPLPIRKKYGIVYNNRKGVVRFPVFVRLISVGGESLKEFEEIYQTHFRDVELYLRAICRDSALAEELTQQAFFQALRTLPTFRGECDIRVWLCAIARNLYLSHLRKEKDTLDIEQLNIPDPRRSIEEQVDDRQQAMVIHRILHELPEPYKEVFSLRIFGQLSFGDIGRIFGRTANWACVTYHRACQKIQAEMEE